VIALSQFDCEQSYLEILDESRITADFLSLMGAFCKAVSAHLCEADCKVGDIWLLGNFFAL
jgi:hypothetical protein